MAWSEPGQCIGRSPSRDVSLARLGSNSETTAIDVAYTKIRCLPPPTDSRSRSWWSGVLNRRGFRGDRFR